MKMLDGQSFDMVHDRIESLKQLFPEAVNEGRLEYDMLMTLLWGTNSTTSMKNINSLGKVS